MLAKFELNSTGNPVSTFTSEPCALVVGTTVKMSHDFDLGQGITLHAGDEGVVTFAGFVSRGRAWVEVLLYKVHPGLREDDNKIILEPFGTEDILNCIVVT